MKKQTQKAKKKDTESKNVDALNCVFIVVHIDGSIAAQDSFSFVTWCLQENKP